MNSTHLTKFPHLCQIGDGIYQSNDSIVKLSGKEIDFLRAEVNRSVKKRARICAHRTDEDPLHEMLIVIGADSYIHPHRHLGKSESFHIIEGEVDIVIFADDGNIEEIIELGDLQSGKKFYYRLDDAKYHTLLIHSEILVVHEVTNGPFSRELTKLAPFAPSEEDRVEALRYIDNLKKKACGLV